MHRYFLYVSSFVCLMLTADAIAQSVLTHADTETSFTRPDTNFGGAGWLHVGQGKSALFAFDLSGISGPVGAALQVKTVSPAFRSPGCIEVRELVSPWGEFTATGSNAPFSGRIVTTQEFPESATGNVITFDVSSLVNDWLANPAQNFGLKLSGCPDGAVDIAVFSREGGGQQFPARLVISSASAGDNVVTVASEGGDYTSPADAADNADSGDQWCDRTVRCQILVEPGNYVIDRTMIISGLVVSGGGRGTTRITAAQGVNTVILAAPDTLSQISGISVVNEQPTSAQTLQGIDGYIDASDIDVIVRGGAGSVGITLRGEFPRSTITSSRIQVGDDINAIGVQGTDAELFDVDLSVSSGGESIGIGGISGVDETGESTDSFFRLDHTTINSTATTDAIGVSVAGIIMSASSVSADSLQNAIGVTTTRNEYEAFVRISDSTITATRSLTGIGIQLSGFRYCSGEIRNSTIRSRAFGVIASGGERDGCNLSISDSEIKGGDPGSSDPALLIRSIGTGDGIRIDRSEIHAYETAIRVTVSTGAPFPLVNVGATKIIGAIDSPFEPIRCVYVYNEDYQPLDSSCN